MQAEDGIEAIDTYKMLLNTNNQNLLCGIFMDYHMPRCSGLEAIKTIRQLEKSWNESPSVQSSAKYIKPCYIVGFTADLSDVSKEILMEAGSDEVMPKPTPHRLLEDTCVRLLNSRA